MAYTDYNVTAAENTTLWAEGMAPSQVNNSGRTMQSDLRSSVAASINNVSACRALTTKGGYITLLGSATVGDIQARSFYWNPTSSATDDGVFTLKPGDINAANPGRWIASNTRQRTQGFLNFGPVSTLTIATGAVTATQTRHDIDTEASTSTDSLVTVNGGVDGDLLILHVANATRHVICTDNTGNLQLAGGANFTLTNQSDTLVLMYDGTNWVEISRSDNS